jgi:phage gpG-like protein
MAGTGVELSGFDEIGRYFDKLGALDKLQFAEFVGEEAIAVSEQAFQEEKDPVTGAGWPDLAESTLKEKRSGKKLVERALLKRSIDYSAFPDGSALVGSNRIYSRIHNEGGMAGPGHQVEIPQRRFLGIDPDFYPRIFADRKVRELIGAED